jgi:iron complex outermembrane recepter protein
MHVPIGSQPECSERHKLSAYQKPSDGAARTGVPLAFQTRILSGVTPGTPEVSAPQQRCCSGWLVVARAVTLLSLTSTLPSPSWAQKPKPDLSDISLDTLANTEITSVSRKEEKLSQSAAAVFVITQEDIRRSGLTSIPELLRMVPGLTVAQIDANKWAITARGFDERLADKMLVLMDGRTVFDPLSSGVYWDVQDTILEDIERIEVIRGPGATLWGANAVNGVVNIITKQAKDTQSGSVTAGGGSQEGEVTAIRYGGTLRGLGYYRVFAKYIHQDAFTDSLGREAADDWHFLHGGFRTDWVLSSRDDLTVQGDLYKGNAGQTVPGLLSLSPPATGTFDDRTGVSGGNLLGRWHRTSSERLDTTLQMYFESVDRNEARLLGEYRHTIDLDFEQHLAGDRHDLVWGGDYRYATDTTTGTLNLSFNPAARSTNLYGAFLQDQITLVPDRLRITVGSKVEHNYYSGFAMQPNARLLWTIRPRYGIWMAISRASENSSRFDADIRNNEDVFAGANGIPTLVSSFGTHHLPPENVVAYQLGQRGALSKWLTFDVAAFYNHYTERHTQEPGVPFFEANPPPLHLVLPTVTRSNISGETHGFEALSQWKLTSFLNLSAGYSLFEIHLHASQNSQDFTTAKGSEGSTPRHACQVRSEVSLPYKLEFDSAVYYVSRLPGPQIPSYARVDARLGWRPTERLETSIGVQNLLDPRHFEFGSGDFVTATQVGRNAYGKLTWRF